MSIEQNRDQAVDEGRQEQKLCHADFGKKIVNFMQSSSRKWSE